MRTEDLRRTLVTVSLIFTLVFSIAFIPTSVLAAAVIDYPVGTIDVVHGQTFLLRHRMQWNDPDDPGFYLVAIKWDYLGYNSWHFTLVDNRAYFDNDYDNVPDLGVAPIEATASMTDNGTMYSLGVAAKAGDWRLGYFNVEITLRASGPDGTPHVGTNNHPIKYTIVQSLEAFPPATVYPAPVTVRVLGRGVAVSISPNENSGPPMTTLSYSITVTNTGDILDNYALTASDNENWGPTLDNYLFENVQPGENMTATLGVTIPENAPTCTEDNITVTVTGTGVENSASCVAHALILRGVELAITPGYQSGSLGRMLEYTIIVFNAGNVEDNYELTASDNENWSPTVSPALLTVPTGENGAVTLSVTVPENAEPCTRDNIIVTATSHGDNTVKDNASCIAQAFIVRGVGVSIDPSHSSDVPGATLSYTVTVTNTGNVADSYDLTISDNENWDLALDDNLFLDVRPGEDRTTTLRVTIPSGAEHGERDDIQVVVASMEVSASASCEAEVSILRRVEVSISPGSGSGEPGTSLTYSVTVRNTGLIDDTYTLRAVGKEGWSVSIEPDSLTLAAGATGVATLSVVVPPDASVGISMTTTVSARSEGDPAVIDTDTCRTIVVGAVPPEVWVDDDWAGSNPGDVVDGHIFGTDAFAMIQDGIDAVASPGTVHVAAGTYYEHITLKDGVQVLGAGADVTTIDGSGTGDVVIGADNSTISGFTITNSGMAGYAGILCRYSSPVIINNKITGNDGRGIFCYYSNATIINNIIANNGDWGIWQNYSTPTINNNLIFGGRFGGGIMCANSSDSIIMNNTIAENFFRGISCDHSSPIITNNIITGCSYWGIISEFSSFPTISYNDVWHNRVDYVGCSPGIGDISDDPMFVDPAAGDYHLQPGSPCIDAGTNEDAPSIDLEGNPRLIDGDGDGIAVVDMGAYEYVPPPPPGIGWDASITATFSGGSDDATFSVRPDATSGFDIAYDLPEPPPPVAPPYVRTFLYYPEQTPNELHRSCLGPEILMEWPLRIEYAEGLNDITLTWRVEDVPADYSIYLYRGENLVADMRAEEDYTFQASTGSYDFRIVVGKLLPFTLELTQGWNMISFPVLPENSSPDAIFGSYFVLYRWNAEDKRYVLHADSGSFIEPDPDVGVGVGYWAYVLEDENVNMLGVPVDQLNLSLRQGWNLIGSTYSGSSIADPIDDPDNSVIPWAFTWNAEERSYRMTQLLEAGKGYWVYTLQYCSLTLPPKEPRKCVLVIEHFSPIAGTTWSGAHHRAGERLDDLYPWLEYVYEEEVGPEEACPVAEDFIKTKGANIVVGNAEFMGMPLADIADDYPDVYFASIIASDLTTKRNFIRYFPRQYQALYLEGLIAGALTETGNIGIVSAFPCVQVCRRQSGFYLGIMDAAEALGKDITLYVKYVGDWYLPTDEAEIARTLVDTYNCDVITQQTDSGSPLDVAEDKGIWFVGKDMDIVGQYGWSSTETVAVSFDTRWEVGYEMMIKDWMAGDETPETILYPGMDDKIILADGTVYPTVDIQNDNKVGIEAISPYARPLIPDEIVELVENRRDQMMKGVWDPFFAHDFISNGTGLALEGLPIPPAGTLVKPEGEMPSDEWLLSKFNFDLEGIVVLE